MPPASAPAGDEAQAAAVYDGEADTELFDIFMEQLTTGINQLVETAGQMARGEAVAQSADRMADQVDRLAATANYMGYDALSAVYDDMLAALETYSSRSETAGAEATLTHCCNRSSSPASVAFRIFSPMPNR